LGFQFLHKFALLEEHYNLCLAFGIDGISLSFLFLTAFIFPLCYLAAINTTFKQKTFLFYLFLLEVLLFLTFTVIDLFYFYVFFESILIPMFIIIGHWGARERKIKAAYYFFLYTLFGSLIMLIGIFYLYLIAGSTNYFVLFNTHLTGQQQKII